MKSCKLIVLNLLALVLMSSCTKNNDEILNEFDLKTAEAIIGQWKQVGSYISSGGPQYYVEATDGEVLNFYDNGRFSSNKYPGCHNGTYSVDDDIITLNFNCGAFDMRFPELDGIMRYSHTIEANKLNLIPRTLMCIEGCSYEYEKISE